MGCNLFSRRKGRGRGSRKFFRPIRSLRGKRYLKSTAKSRQFGGKHCNSNKQYGGANMFTNLGNTVSRGIGNLWGSAKNLGRKAVDEGEELGTEAGRAVGKGVGAVGTAASDLGTSVKRRLGGGGSRRRRRGRKSRRRRRKGCGCK